MFDEFWLFLDTKMKSSHRVDAGCKFPNELTDAEDRQPKKN